MKKILLALITLLILGSSVMTVYAYEEPKWLIDPNNYKEKNRRNWFEVEGEAEVKQWAKNNSIDIKSISDEDQRYRACVKKVCDFLSYDIKYMGPMIYYTLRDGKGVCADYTALTKALCDEVGITSVISVGRLNNDGHDMLKVTIKGQEYYSDPTHVDTGLVDVYQMTPGYVEEYVAASDNLMISATGFDKGEWTENVLAAPEGYRTVQGRSGKIYYIPDAELCQAEDGLISFESLLVKYGVD